MSDDEPQIRTTDYDRIITSVPLNRTAALVTGRGTHWEPEPGIYGPDDVVSDTPLPIKTLKSFETNLTNQKTLRLLVVGAHALLSRTWVVRCTCSLYELRTTEDLTKHKDSIHSSMCKRCQYVEEIKANGGRRPLQIPY
jgi:hypothetical protein